MELETGGIWALHDDRAGHKAQTLGIAEALGVPFRSIDLVYTAAADLPNFLMGASFGGLTADTRVQLTAPWPHLVIAAGRRTAPVARHIRDLAAGSCRIVQIMLPGHGALDKFDLIVAPNHDRPEPRDNLITMTGAPHRFTREKLDAIAVEWRDRFAGLPRPWIALLMGGGSKRKGFPERLARELGARASALARSSGGSLLVTTSRRTDAKAAEALLSAIDVPTHVFRWGDGGDNPYAAYLALADHLIVTGDSISMASEACASGRPVLVYAPREIASHKHRLFAEELFARNHARPLGESLEAWTPEPLNEAGRIAAEVRKRFGI